MPAAPPVPPKVNTFSWNGLATSLLVNRVTAVVGPLMTSVVSAALTGVASHPAAGPADQRSGAPVVFVASVGV